MHDRTNILFITSDQQHFNTLGALNPRIKTPQLDRLAATGVLFERAYTPNPVCTPSRASMITGQYPSFHEAWTIGCMLPADTRTVAHRLAEAGYATGLIGKAHFHPLARTDRFPSIECQPILRDLDFWRKFHGPWYGFEHIELTRNHADEAHAGMHYGVWLEEQGLANWREFFQEPDGPPKPRSRHWSIPAEYHYTRWTGLKIIEYLEKCKSEDRPFFAWASFHDPHPPYMAPEPWASMYDPDDMEPGRLVEGEHEKNPPHFAMTQDENADWSDYEETHWSHGCHYQKKTAAEIKQDMATYYGMVSFMDDEIGKILDWLRENDLEKNTLVVFTTDHGHFLGQHGLTAKGPFHYEDLIRIPFIVSCPGRVPRGGRSQALQSLVDLVPTWLDCAGLEIGGEIQGVSQWDVWQGKSERARDHVLVENRHQPRKIHHRTYVNDRYKLTVYRERPAGELFDLERDPGEIDNLWNDANSQMLKLELMQKFLSAEMEREPTRMTRIAGA